MSDIESKKEWLRINNLNAGHVFTITPDGTIIRGEAFTTNDAASLSLWESIEYMFKQKVSEQRPVVDEYIPQGIAMELRKMLEPFDRGEGFPNTTWALVKYVTEELKRERSEKGNAATDASAGIYAGSSPAAPTNPDPLLVKVREFVHKAATWDGGRETASKFALEALALIDAKLGGGV